jgi:hypothetical protein
MRKVFQGLVGSEVADNVWLDREGFMDNLGSGNYLVDRMESEWNRERRTAERVWWEDNFETYIERGDNE